MERETLLESPLAADTVMTILARHGDRPEIRRILAGIRKLGDVLGPVLLHGIKKGREEDRSAGAKRLWPSHLVCWVDLRLAG